MNHPQESWQAMKARLAAFVKKHGHCNVPTNFKADPQLGRWVAAQRHRRKIGLLAEAQIRTLECLSFIWAPAEKTWEQMFAQLREFKKRRGHCNVPTRWARNTALADWVQRQRLSHKRGRLSRERVQRLEKLDFVWAIYKGQTETESLKPKAKEAPAEELVSPHCERLYCIRNGTFVQHTGKGKMPRPLEQYLRSHSGEAPPYIPLPMRPVEFRFGEGWKKPWKVRWRGRGRLPQIVLDYVSEHGTLPPHD